MAATWRTGNMICNRVFKQLWLLISLWLLTSASIAAETSDSCRCSSRHCLKLSGFILPSGLAIAGSALNYGDFRYQVRDRLAGKTHTKIDNYLVYVPIAEMYAGDIMGGKPCHTAFDQTKYLAFSEIITVAIVQSLKRITNVTRPDGTPHSFPSGHTTQAFMGATALYLEYKDSNVPLAYSGYVIGSAAGILRMTNNRHWISDVLAGAGIGMLVTRLVYYVEPLKNWQPFEKQNHKISIVPGASLYDGNMLLTLHCRF